jgi:DNA-binding phage protein
MRDIIATFWEIDRTATFGEPTSNEVLHICHRACYAYVMPKKTTHQAAVSALLSEAERVEHARQVLALQARNAMLTILDTTREKQGITKQTLASRAGLDASSVRRLLTSTTANPTTDNAFRLMAAMGIALEAKLPTGERVQVVGPGALDTTTEPAAAA